MKSQFYFCNVCIDKKCCKIVPPAIFEFEKEKFKGFIVSKFFKKIFLLKKKGKFCIFLKNNKCSIYKKRPFNCKMFPFDIKKIKNEYYWIIWNFCFIPKNVEKHLKKLEKLLSKIKREELDIYIYIYYTSKSKYFKNLKFKVLRKIEK